MKYILLSCILLITQNFAEVTAHQTPSEDKVKKESDRFISKRRKRSDRKVRPAYKYYLLNRDTYYYRNVMPDCDTYLRIIAQKDREIEALNNEIDRLRGTAQESLQNKLKKEYELKLKKFDERKSSIRTKNRVRISNEPIKE